MNSRESPGIVAGQIAVVGVRMLDIAIEKGVAAGVKAATDRIEEERKKERKGRYDRRLHNTRLLLKNYRVLKHHALDAVHTGARANEVISENAVDILDDLESMGFRKVDDRLYIESIKRSQQRTRIIIEHIDEMLRYWRIDCEQSGREEALRRYRIVVDTYISDDQMTAEELAQREHIEKRTVYKDIKAAMRPLSALIFGIDGIKQE
ncbi:hypothetical protein [uncultured Oscillibacter sp.]|jgi:hypothetical protein|uniref:hypothetical protein n=1 Tax=uncultured Oscillibacter sp. TaxID=876091 RepID=UPI00266F6EA6|nr:hypothetical protein [uncultured Oscillibacter sp.]